MLRVSAQVGEFGMGEGIMQAVCWIELKYDVCALCMGVPDLPRALGGARGGRLPKWVWQ